MTTPSQWSHFSIEELSCRCCGEMEMVDEFMQKLVELRNNYGKAMPVSSGYRCSRHNALVSKTGQNGPHTQGRATDILVSRKNAFILLALAMPTAAEIETEIYRFTGIGIKQKGATRFLHLDDLSHTGRPTLWGY